MEIYTRKPTEVVAVQYTGSNVVEINDFLKQWNLVASKRAGSNTLVVSGVVDNEEGDDDDGYYRELHLRGYIYKEGFGMTICDSDYFEQRFELVSKR